MTAERYDRSGAAMARIEIVDDDRGFDELGSIWTSLEQSADLQSPCQRWDWSRLWWQHFRRDRDRLWIILVRVGDDIVGMCPLYVRDARAMWGRRLRFLATGEPEQDEVASEFLDVLAGPEHVELVGTAVTRAIFDSRKWREAEFRNILDSAALARQCAVSAVPGQSRVRRGARYTLSLHESWDDYLARLAPRFRSRVRAHARALEGGCHSLVEVSASERPEVFALMAQLHQQRWKRKGYPGAFASPRFCAFHRDLLRIWGGRREALLRVLRAEETIVGVLYSFRWLRQEFYYQSGFATDSGLVTSPGVACHVGAIRQARAEGLASYDFMLGKLVSYKADYGCDAAPVADLRLDRRSPAGRVFDRVLRKLGGS